MEACLGTDCVNLVCDLAVNIQAPIYNNNNTPSVLTDDTFTFDIVINGSNSAGWEGGGQTGTYGQTFTFGPYPVDQDGAFFQIKDIAIGETCSTTVGVNMNSCLYTGECACCGSGD